MREDVIPHGAAPCVRYWKVRIDDLHDRSAAVSQKRRGWNILGGGIAYVGY